MGRPPSSAIVSAPCARARWPRCSLSSSTLTGMQLPHSSNQTLTHLMLRLLSSKAQGSKDFLKPSKLFHVGIYWIALSSCSQMSSHLPGFQSIFFLHHFFNSQTSHQQEGYIYYYIDIYSKDVILALSWGARK